MNNNRPDPRAQPQIVKAIPIVHESHADPFALKRNFYRTSQYTPYLLQLVISIDSFTNVFKHGRLSIMNDDSLITKGSYELGAVRGHNHRSVETFVKHLGLAFPLEILIAHQNDLVDQIAIKFDSQGQRESETGAHAGRIGLYWHAQLFAELCKVFNETPNDGIFSLIYPCNEAGIIETRQTALKPPGEAEWPRYRHFADDFAGGRHFDSADQFDQRAFPCAIAAQKANPIPRIDTQVDTLQNLLLPAAV